jgi:hypothetical protein
MKILKVKTIAFPFILDGDRDWWLLDWKSLRNGDARYICARALSWHDMSMLKALEPSLLNPQHDMFTYKETYSMHHIADAFGIQDQSFTLYDPREND